MRYIGLIAAVLATTLFVPVAHAGEWMKVISGHDGAHFTEVDVKTTSLAISKMKDGVHKQVGGIFRLQEAGSNRFYYMTTTLKACKKASGSLHVLSPKNHKLIYKYHVVHTNNDFASVVYNNLCIAARFDESSAKGRRAFRKAVKKSQHGHKR